MFVAEGKQFVDGGVEGGTCVGGTEGRRCDTMDREELSRDSVVLKQCLKIDMNGS